MVVQLRIVKPAREVGERGRDDPGHVLFDDAAGTGTGVKDVGLGIGEDVVDRFAMALRDDGFGVLVGERPGRRNALAGLCRIADYAEYER
jgi:hypothetical protein